MVQCTVFPSVARYISQLSILVRVLLTCLCLIKCSCSHALGLTYFLFSCVVLKVCFNFMSIWVITAFQNDHRFMPTLVAFPGGFPLWVVPSINSLTHSPIVPVSWFGLTEMVRLVSGQMLVQVCFTSPFSSEFVVVGLLWEFAPQN